MTQPESGPDGVLIVDKPSGPTSHDVVSQARRLFRTRRVGHAGTLDPMATGVLVLLFGEATKLCDVATSANKAYRAEVCFGRATDSHDACGRTTSERPGLTPPLPAFRAALEQERQRTLQRPPSVSALKVGGRRAHELSRAGAPPLLAERPVHVISLELEAWEPPRARLLLDVSKGYYVRALARDLAEALGVPAHLSALRRLRSGMFSLDEASAWPPPADPPGALISLADALPRLLPTLRLTADGVRRAVCGQVLRAEHFLDAPAAPGQRDDVAAWTSADGLPIALGERTEQGYRVKRGFVGQSASVQMASTDRATSFDSAH